MKNIKIKKATKNETVKIGEGTFASDWFRCSNPRCGYEIQMKVYGNHPRCPQCGSLMSRL